jgi:hypothetical protein
MSLGNFPFLETLFSFFFIFILLLTPSPVRCVAGGALVLRPCAALLSGPYFISVVVAAVFFCRFVFAVLLLGFTAA